MVRLIAEINETINFFTNEIKQYEIMLNGTISEDYRAYINNKIKYYKFAVNIIRKIILQISKERGEINEY